MLASRIPIPSPRSTRMEENPKSIARPRGCPRPTRYKKSTETSWDDQTSRCHDGNVAPVDDDDDRNEAACRRSSSRGFSRRPIRPPKPLGSVNKKTPRRSVKNDEPRWRVASAKSTRENRSTVPSCDAIKETRMGVLSHSIMVRRRRRRTSYRRRRRHYQRGGILPFLIPLGFLAAKAAAAGAISGGVGYGVKKALDRRR